MKKAINDFHNFSTGTTKGIKSKPDTVNEELEILDAPKEKRYDVGTKIFKVFYGTEYKGSVMGYNNHTKLYHIIYKDEDTKEMYHNEIKSFHSSNVKRLLAKKKYKTKKTIAATNLIKHYPRSEMEYEEHILSLSTADVCVIVKLRYKDVDLSKEAILTEMIQICINTLSLDHMTREEVALGYFIRKKLKTLSTWNEWKAGETFN